MKILFPSSVLKILISQIIFFSNFGFIIAPQLKAQDTTKPFYFPHKTGDMWEYFYSDGPMYVDTLQNFTIFDSTDSKGIIHIRQHARFINPIEPSPIFPDTSRFLVDTANNNIYYEETIIDRALVYKLNAQKGDQWIVRTNIYVYDLARIIDKWKGSIFGRNTTFMEIFYYQAPDSTDTTGYSVNGIDILADGYGLISRGGGELLGQINIIGAVINDTLYGDTTKVTGINNKYILPIPDQVKLFQNYPNPFNPSTNIEFEINEYSLVSLRVYDILGNAVANLINEEKHPGRYSVRFNRDRLSSGVYFYKLSAGGKTQVKKMILLQ